MEDLAYYAANAPERRDRRTGRIVTAGTLMCLAALPFGFYGVLLGSELPRIISRGNESVWAVFVWFVLVFITLWFFTAGLGLLMGRRWARPVTLVVTTVWLTFGSVGLLLTLIEYLRGPYQYGGLAYFSIVEFGLSVAVVSFLGVVFPMIIYRLISPANVEVALANLDPEQRWTDGLSVRRWATVLILLCLACITGAIYPTSSGYSSWWAIQSVPRLSIVCATALFALSALTLAMGRPVGNRIALGFAISAFAVLLYIGYQGDKRRAFNFSDSASFLCFLMAVDAICVLQIRRESRPQ